MDRALQEIIDHHQIRKVLGEYCIGCDRCDRERMASVYCLESWDDHGVRSATGAEFANAITGEMEHIASVSHMLGQSTIAVDGDVAGAETYFLANLRVSTAAEEETIHQLGGRFLDKLARESGTWKIKHRTAVRDWSISLPVVEDFMGRQGLKEGGRRDDLCFSVLGLHHSGQPDFAHSR